MTKEEWLESLKVGDKVAVIDRYRTKVAVIERITPTRQIKIGTNTYKNGHCKGSTIWDYGSRIEPVTQEILDNIKHKELAYRIGKVDFNKLNLDQLKQIYRIIDEVQTQEVLANEKI